MLSFEKIRSSQNSEITLSFTDIGKSCRGCEFLTSQMSFKAFHKSKIFAKISEFTVSYMDTRNEVLV